MLGCIFFWIKNLIIYYVIIGEWNDFAVRLNLRSDCLL